jgi:hypothetical protein
MPCFKMSCSTEGYCNLTNARELKRVCVCVCSVCNNFTPFSFLPNQVGLPLSDTQHLTGCIPLESALILSALS